MRGIRIKFKVKRQYGHTVVEEFELKSMSQKHLNCGQNYVPKRIKYITILFRVDLSVCLLQN